MHVIRDYGRFISPTEVQAGETVIDRAPHRYCDRARRPSFRRSPVVEERDRYYTNENIFELRERPEHLLVIGGGPIGMEMAQAHVRLGSKVTVIEGLKAIGRDDPEAAAVVLGKDCAEGIEIVEGRAWPKRSPRRMVQITVKTSKGDFTGSHLLMAVGRKVNIDKLDLDKGNVDHDRAVKVDAGLRSVSNRGFMPLAMLRRRPAVHPCGGVSCGGDHPLDAVGSAVEGETRAYPLGHLYRPGTGADRPDRGGGAEGAWRCKLTVARFDYRRERPRDCGRQDRRFHQGDGRQGQACGCHHRGRGAGELIGVWALAIANGLKMSAVANMVRPIPHWARSTNGRRGPISRPSSLIILRSSGLSVRAAIPCPEAP